MEIDQDTQRKILVNLAHNPGMRYNQLWNREGESNRFNYHLRNLMNKGMVEKNEEIYSLTSKGKTYVTNLDGKTGKKKQAPVICSFILGYDSETGKILVNIRKKEPFYDFLGIPGGKIRFGESPIETARNEFLEETGLEGDMTLAGVKNYVTYEKNSVFHHVIAFTYICQNCKGKLIEKHREGENRWIFPEEMDDYKCYPGIKENYRDFIRNIGSVRFINATRKTENGEFMGDFDVIDEF